MFKKKEKKLSMEESSVDVIEKEIKSYRFLKYILLAEYFFTLLIGFYCFMIAYLHYSAIALLFAVISVSVLCMLQNRTQYLCFLVYIKKGEP